jgi:mycofactocin system creatininase family protein
MSSLGGLTWPEAESTAVLLVPLGSCEQHGPHLPLDTDTRIAVALAEMAARQHPGLVVVPALAYGASGEHAAFAGTLSIGLSVLEQVIVELVRSADHFAGAVLVNAHGGNTHAVDRAVRTLRSEGRAVISWQPRVPGGDAHAGQTETSLMLAVAPDLVRGDRAVAGCCTPLAALLPTLESAGVRAVSESGVLGDPTGASAEEGRALLEALAGDLAAVIVAWAR